MWQQNGKVFSNDTQTHISGTSAIRRRKPHGWCVSGLLQILVFSIKTQATNKQTVSPAPKAGFVFYNNNRKLKIKTNRAHAPNLMVARHGRFKEKAQWHSGITYHSGLRQANPHIQRLAIALPRWYGRVASAMRIWKISNRRGESISWYRHIPVRIKSPVCA